MHSICAVRTESYSRQPGQLGLVRQAPVNMLSKAQLTVTSLSVTALGHFLHCRHEVFIASSTPYQQLIASHFQTQLVRTQLILAGTYFLKGHFQTILLHQPLNIVDQSINPLGIYSLLGCVHSQTLEPGLSPVVLRRAGRAAFSCLLLISLSCRCKSFVHAVRHTGTTLGTTDCSS